MVDGPPVAAENRLVFDLPKVLTNPSFISLMREVCEKWKWVPQDISCAPGGLVGQGARLSSDRGRARWIGVFGACKITGVWPVFASVSKCLCRFHYVPWVFVCDYMRCIRCASCTGVGRAHCLATARPVPVGAVGWCWYVRWFFFLTGGGLARWR